MEHNSSFVLFKQALSRFTSEIQEGIYKLLISFGDSDENEKVRLARALNQNLSGLSRLLDASHTPNWLHELLKVTNIFLDKKDALRSKNLINALLSHQNDIKPIRFDSEFDQGFSFDFDALFETAKKEESIGDLFDGHIAAISRIIESGLIEYVTILDALKILLQVLKANRDGSYASVKKAIWFSSYMKNVVFVAIRKIKGVNVLVEAAERTHEDLSDGIEKIEERLNDEIKKHLQHQLPKIEQLSEIIEQNPLALPAPEATAIGDE